MSKKEEIEGKVILFDLKSQKDIRIEYPELADVEEFAELKTPTEVRLCWLIGNRTSPIFNLERKAKIRKAIDMVYNGDISHKPELQKMYEYKNGEKDIPDRIFNAIGRMVSYDTESRLRAKLMSQYMFDMLNEMIVLDASVIKTMDMDDKKKYAELLIKVNSELPKIVQTLESGFGVKTVRESNGDQILVNINNVRM